MSGIRSSKAHPGAMVSANDKNMDQTSAWPWRLSSSRDRDRAETSKGKELMLDRAETSKGNELMLAQIQGTDAFKSNDNILYSSNGEFACN
ncbi:hypothetical protein Sjap_000132 [Stephania japonica]|uniref:Uncharacterized protein n=1 Tax=Stephania japonica TaxID=461633 RepID=A0AAP0KHH7_9MAGN